MAKKTKDSTATPSLSTPMPTKVQVDEEQRPVAVSLFGVEVGVAAIYERWEDEEDWWKDNPVVRVTYRISLEDGQKLTVFKNTLTGGWYRQ